MKQARAYVATMTAAWGIWTRCRTVSRKRDWVWQYVGTLLCMEYKIKPRTRNRTSISLTHDQTLLQITLACPRLRVTVTSMASHQ